MTFLWTISVCVGVGVCAQITQKTYSIFHLILISAHTNRHTYIPAQRSLTSAQLLPVSPVFSPSSVPSDEDECVTGHHCCICHARCVNTDGSYTCQCENDYTGDGFSCWNRKSGRSQNGMCFECKLSKRSRMTDTGWWKKHGEGLQLCSLWHERSVKRVHCVLLMFVFSPMSYNSLIPCPCVHSSSCAYYEHVHFNGCINGISLCFELWTKKNTVCWLSSVSTFVSMSTFCICTNPFSTVGALLKPFFSAPHTL